MACIENDKFGAKNSSKDIQKFSDTLRPMGAKFLKFILNIYIALNIMKLTYFTEMYNGLLHIQDHAKGF